MLAVATANVGAAGSVTLRPTFTRTGPGSLFICQTSPTTGACTTAIGPSVTTTLGAGTTSTFGVFAAGAGLVAFDPAFTRVRVSITDGSNVLRGATLVSFTTQTEVANSGGTLNFADATI